MKLKKLSLALLGLYVPLAFAQAGFTVRHIRVEGNRNIESATVVHYLPVHPGQEMTAETAQQTVRALYATGLFSDVQLRDENGTLVVAVKERPLISEINIVGAKTISKADLLKGLQAMRIVPNRVYDPAQVERAVAEIRRAYAARGLSDVQITPAATPQANNRVALTLTIAEGQPVRVSGLHITGNQAFGESQLLRQFTLHPSGLTTRFTHNDQYTPEKLQADLERLRDFYLDHGYLDFRINSSEALPTPDGRAVNIRIGITEGQPYKVSTIAFAGNPIVPTSELDKLVSMHPGDTFSKAQLSDSIQRIGDRLGSTGYAFANVRALPQIDAARHTVALTLAVDPGRRVYIHRINISGNVKTKDAVIRREFRQLESGWYNTTAINRSKERLNRLGFFSDVKIGAAPVPGSPDQVDLDVNVTERSTGQISVGAGYSTTDKLFLSGGIAQQNVLGSGNTASFQLNTGKVNRTLALSYTNPYYTPDGVSRGFDLYNRRFDSTSLTGVAPYVTTTTGAGVRYGIPLSENNSANVGVAVENTRIGLVSGSPQRYQQFVEQHGTSNTIAPVTAGYTNDTRDSLIFPTKGHLNSLQTEVGIGTLRYYKFSYQGQIYKPITANTTLLFNTNLGYAGGQLPFYKNFYAGGPGSVRGYAWGAIGPKDPVDQVSLGGTRLATANLEYLFPMPGMADSKNVRMSVFADAGDVWGGGTAGSADNSFSFSRVRYSAGVGVTWYSPLGPLKFSLAKALKKQPEDKTEPFQFTIGTTF